MWTKEVRRTITILLYNLLFSEQLVEMTQPADMQLQIAAIAEEYGFELGADQTQLIHEQLNTFNSNREVYTRTLQAKLSSWDKTYDLVKACLFAGQLEISEFATANTDEENKKMISKYIHLTQDLVGGQNPGLVHAVLSGIVEAG